jgi:prepilin-type N-terminal cleavage/methylation domain-containing protein
MGPRQGGFTLIEVLVTVMLFCMMMIGFRYVLKGFWEQINRSWSERFMEQYGNSVVEYIARNLVNAKGIYVPPNTNNYGIFYVSYEDPNLNAYTVKYSSTQDEGVLKDNEKIFEDFPPENTSSHVSSILGPSEEFELIEFRIDSVYRPYSPFFNTVDFRSRLFKITLKLSYTRYSTKPGTQDYVREMWFTGQVSLKNREALSNTPPGG